MVNELVIKPVEGSGGYGIVLAPTLRKELATISKKIRSDPRGWIAQPVVQLSTVRPQIDDSLAPGTSTCARSPSIDGGPGLGAARRPDPRRAARGSLVVNSSQGRRLQGHLGAGIARVGGRPRTRRSRGGAVTCPRRPRAPRPRTVPTGRHNSGNSSNRKCYGRANGSQQSQQQRSSSEDLSMSARAEWGHSPRSWGHPPEGQGDRQ